jgi:hypothetical protein
MSSSSCPPSDAGAEILIPVEGRTDALFGTNGGPTPHPSSVSAFPFFAPAHPTPTDSKDGHGFYRGTVTVSTVASTDWDLAHLYHPLRMTDGGFGSPIPYATDDG